MRAINRQNSGMTLVETAVSIAIMAFMFAALAFLVFYTGRNSYIVHEQVQSQNSASSGIERIANTLRNARSFDFHGSDDSGTTPLLKLVYGMPDPNDYSNITTGIVAFKAPSAPGATDGVIRIYDNVAAYESDDKPDWEYGNIARFSIIKQSPYWAHFRVSYIYRGFILSNVDSDGDGIADSTLAGEFATDVIAKNHHTGENSNADYTSSTLVSL